MSDCGHQCHQIGGPYIAENPDCPIHGVNGLDPDDARELIGDLSRMLQLYVERDDGSSGIDRVFVEMILERAATI